MYTNKDVEKEVVPAHLGFLAIYNPSLGATDESVENQIVYYYSSPNFINHGSPEAEKKISQSDITQQQRDEQLRQVGFAQGIVQFGKIFSHENFVQTIDTEKSRIVLHELEPNWWILASINLTILPQTPGASTNLEQQFSNKYCSRDVKPTELLLSDLLRAHSTFLLHHASSMNVLYMQIKLSKFRSYLAQYWNQFSRRWNVLMHGNPANNLFSAIKIAACGELGIGVGEEHRGSAEREVLEGFPHRIKGMVDVIVSKFGDGKQQEVSSNEILEDEHQTSWIGQGKEPGIEDGAIFLGTGFLSRKSIRNISYWIEDLYQWGKHTYGVHDSSSSYRSKRSRKENTSAARNKSLEVSESFSKMSQLESQVNEIKLNDEDISTREPMIPRSKIRRNSNAIQVLKRKDNLSSTKTFFIQPNANDRWLVRNNLINYLTLGYGKYWSLGETWSNNTQDAHTSVTKNPSKHNLSQSSPHRTSIPAELRKSKTYHSRGHFLIGLASEIEDLREIYMNASATSDQPELKSSAYPQKLVRRKLILELEHGEEVSDDTRENASSEISQRNQTSYKDQATPDSKTTDIFQVVVYTVEPFIFVFLFTSDIDDLALPDFYRILHHQIQPILSPLYAFTKFRNFTPEYTTESSELPIFNLIWDPKNLTINSTIPNIPSLSESRTANLRYPLWSGPEALSTHMQIIKSYIASKDSFELERICKTSRGWWIAWTKIPDSTPAHDERSLLESVSKSKDITSEGGIETIDIPGRSIDLRSMDPFAKRLNSEKSHSAQHTVAYSKNIWAIRKEILLIRRASNSVMARSVSRFSSAASLLRPEDDRISEQNTLVQGIGVDTRRYIESLLNLNP